MATEDVVQTAMDALEAIAEPTDNPQVTALKTQIATLQQQLADAQTQLNALLPDDAQNAKQALQMMRQMNNRMSNLVVARGNRGGGGPGGGPKPKQ